MAEDKLEEETYSLIFTSLKHPIRRRILRMLADKPLTFSEIQEQINIDSGHLSYHIENLGGLVMHNQNGDYKLSSIGVAAVRLMSGVEEHPSVYSNKKPKRPQVLSKVFSLVLATTLIVMSLHFVTYTTSISTATLNQDRIYPTPFVIGAGQTFEFNVTLEYWHYASTMIPMGNLIVSRMLYGGPFGPEAYTFEVQPAPNNLTAQAAGSMWLDFRLNTTSRTKNNTFILMPFGFPNDLLVDVYTPNENKSLGELDWTYGKIDHFTSPIVEVNQLGTYRFIMKNNDSNEWTGVLRPNVEWQIIEKPYFYYGIMGLVFATGYLGFMSYRLLSKSQKTPNQRAY